jgi:hypothetical protein
MVTDLIFQKRSQGFFVFRFSLGAFMEGLTHRAILVFGGALSLSCYFPKGLRVVERVGAGRKFKMRQEVEGGDWAGVPRFRGGGVVLHNRLLETRLLSWSGLSGGRSCMRVVGKGIEAPELCDCEFRRLAIPLFSIQFELAPRRRFITRIIAPPMSGMSMPGSGVAAVSSEISTETPPALSGR